MVYALCDSVGRKHRIGTMLRIGRDPANQIVLQDPRVAPFHAILSEHQGILYLRDENSGSGTFVNRARIQGLGRITAGATITIGGASFTVAQMPEQTFAPPVSRQPAKKLGCLSLWPLAIYLVLSIACLGFFGGAYYLYKAPQATKIQVLTVIGLGPATVQIENLSDVTVYVFASATLDRKKDDGTTPGILWQLSSFGTNSTPNQSAGVYRIDFGTQSGDMDLGTCIYNIKSGEVYHFVVLPGSIIVDRTEYPPVFDHNPASIGEYTVATSSVCKYTQK